MPGKADSKHSRAGKTQMRSGGLNSMLARTLHPWRTIGRALSPRHPVLLRYTGGLLSEVAKRTFIVLVAVEVVYLSDVVISYLLPRVLEFEAGVLDLLLLIVLAMPEVLTIALPLTLLIATYLTLLRRREAREFIIMAGTGYGPRALIALALMVGVGGLSLSLLLTGYAEPHTRYLTRKVLFDIVYGALRDGELSAGKFYEIGDLVVFASSGRIAGVAGNAFIHQRLDNSRYRVIVANKTVRMNTIEGAKTGLILENAAVHEFEKRDASVGGGDAPAIDSADCSACGAGRDMSTLSVLTSNRLFVETPTAEVPQIGARGESIEEWTNFELLSQDTTITSVASTLGVRLLRALLCFLAPLLALLSAGLTTQRTFLIALPLAAAAVLFVSFFTPYAVNVVVPVGLAGTMAIAVAWAAGVALLVVWSIQRFQAGCVGPAGVRL